MDGNIHPPEITDSPWFWVCVFSAMALAGTIAIGPKYELRQSSIELRHEARLRSSEFEARVAAAGGDRARAREQMQREYAKEQFDEQFNEQREIAVRLAPLYLLISIIFLASLGRVCWLQAKAEQAPLLDWRRGILLLLSIIYGSAMLVAIWYAYSAEPDPDVNYITWGLRRADKAMQIFLIASILMGLALTGLWRKKEKPS